MPNSVDWISICGEINNLFDFEILTLREVPQLSFGPRSMISSPLLYGGQFPLCSILAFFIFNLIVNAFQELKVRERFLILLIKFLLFQVLLCQSAIKDRYLDSPAGNIFLVVSFNWREQFIKSVFGCIILDFPFVHHLPLFAFDEPTFFNIFFFGIWWF